VSHALDSQVYESQPNVIFKYDSLQKQQKNVSLEIDFNNAVLYMQQKQYLKAITILKKTAKILKIPSFLNIGICYYKLDSHNNAYLYLKKIYDLKEATKEDIYSYMSASYYLYLVTNDRKYLATITDLSKKISTENFTEDIKRLVADTYIVIKNYEMALKIIDTMEYKDDLKIALLYLQIKNYDMALIHLNSAYENYGKKEKLHEILWFKIFRDLKANSLGKLQEDIALLEKSKINFKTNRELPLEIFFNPKKYSAKEYLQKVTNFDEKRKIDMIFYFAPFIFIDREEIFNDSVMGYVLEDERNIEIIDSMIEYNYDLLEIIKKDPIIRAVELEKNLKSKYGKKSYEYYNLALSFAQIYDFKKAHTYFKKAYDLSHGNKLYSSMTLISAKRAKIKLEKNFETKLRNNLLSKNGNFDYLGKYVYKIIFDEKFVLPEQKPNRTDRKSIFLRALQFIDKSDESGFSEDEPLLAADMKDPLVYLLRILAKKDFESEYEYIARLQDIIPKEYNDYYLKGAIFITNYYIDVVKALGVFNKVDFEIEDETAPTYLRTDALIKLHHGKAVRSIKILENLQQKYNLYDKYTSEILIAAFLMAKDYSNAFATIGMLQFEQEDPDAKFLSAVQLIQTLKLNGALQFLKFKYEGDLIDFRIVGFEEYLESL
jgi:Tfp pilus assembly protein PilF